MPKFLDNIEFWTQGYPEQTIEVEQETRQISINDDGVIKPIDLVIPATEITLQAEDAKLERITNIPREIKTESDIGLYKISNLTQAGLQIIEDRIDGGLEELNSINLNNGSGSGSIVQRSFEYDGDAMVFTDGTKGSQPGDIIPGAIASGMNSVALGGLKYDYYTSPETHEFNITQDPESEENFGRTPTSAEGNQSFAWGGSSHAYGDWSMAGGKDAKAYQNASFSLGGSCTSGMSKDEFDSYFYDSENGKPLHEGKGIINNEITDATGRPWRKSMSFAFAGGEVCRARARGSVSFGYHNDVIGNYSASICGNNNIIENSNCFVAGRGNKTGAAFQTILGKYSTIDSKMLFQVGVGTSNADRKTGFSVDLNGVAHVLNSNLADPTAVVRSNDIVYLTKKILNSSGNIVLEDGTSNIYKGTGSGNVIFGKLNNVDGTNSSFCFGVRNNIYGNMSFVWGRANNIYAGDSFVAGLNNELPSGYNNGGIIIGADNKKIYGSGFIFGKNNEIAAAGDPTYRVIVGCDNKLQNTSTMAIGKSLVSGGANQVLFGSYNESVSTNGAIVFGSGSSETNRHTILVGINDKLYSYNTISDEEADKNSVINRDYLDSKLLIINNSIDNLEETVSSSISTAISGLQEAVDNNSSSISTLQTSVSDNSNSINDLWTEVVTKGDFSFNASTGILTIDIY